MLVKPAIGKQRNHALLSLQTKKGSIAQYLDINKKERKESIAPYEARRYFSIGSKKEDV